MKKVWSQLFSKPFGIIKWFLASSKQIDMHACRNNRTGRERKESVTMIRARIFSTSSDTAFFFHTKGIKKILFYPSFYLFLPFIRSYSLL